MSTVKAVKQNSDGCMNSPQMKTRYYKPSQLFAKKLFFQQYKEGKTILERALIQEKDGFSDGDSHNSLLRSHSISRARFLQSTDDDDI